jgi:hypothetical protein
MENDVNEQKQTEGKRRMFRGLALILTPLMLVGVILLASLQVGASSHREAPLISKDPYADNTDTYVWIPAGQTKNIVLAASWIPFEGPEGGPNYFEWDDRVLYDIHVDNDGDAVADVTYTLSSRTEVQNPDTFLYNTGPMTSLNDADWNRRQYISVTETWAQGAQPQNTPRVNPLISNKLTAPVNIGSKSTPNYGNLAKAAQFSVRAGNGNLIKIFGGQTDDAFWVDLQVFDLLTLRGQAPPVGYSTGNNDPVDSVAGFNVHSLIIELPITRLTAGNETVLGVWSTARRATMPVLNAEGNVDIESHEYAQVSRLGMPLVNEVVLPMGLKDTFNSISPSVDLTVYGALQESVEDPEVGNLLCALYGVPLPGDMNNDCATEYNAGTPRTGRGDIFDIFLTGMVLADEFTINTRNGTTTLPAGFNVNRPANVVPAEMIRINTAIKGNLCPRNPSRLGVLGGDACGFPNGRRPMDDTVEIELLAVAGAAYSVLDGRDTDFTFNPALIGVLDDGIDANDVPFRNAFPYFAAAQSGQQHIHQNPGNMNAPAAAGLINPTRSGGDAGGPGSAVSAATPALSSIADRLPTSIISALLLTALVALVAKAMQVRRRLA